MNQLTNLNQVQTMSSREIAELTDKNHADVMRDIRKIVEELGQSIFAESSYINSQNKSQPEYLLNKENSLLVVSGYSVTLRKKIIDRWQELENKQTKLPTTYIEALKALVASEEGKLLAEQKIKTLTHQGKLYTSSEIAKELGLKSAQSLNQILMDNKIQYKVNGTWVLAARYSELGYVSIKQVEVGDEGKVVYDRRWTGIGRDFILELTNEPTRD